MPQTSPGLKGLARSLVGGGGARTGSPQASLHHLPDQQPGIDASLKTLSKTSQTREDEHCMISLTRGI